MRLVERAVTFFLVLGKPRLGDGTRRSIAEREDQVVKL